MEKLSLPRRNYLATDPESSSPPVCRPGLPKNPLPTWVTLPMDAKLPMVPGPKNNVLLYTTNLGEKRHMSTPELDFDLTDPYSLTMSNDYKPLHDPHLKPHLDTKQMRKRLCKGGFITPDGKVTCTLREYNEYRQYLRRINLAVDRKRKQAEGNTSPQKPCVGRDGDQVAATRESRVKQIRERLQQQYDENKSRSLRLIAEEEARRRRLRDKHKSRISEMELHLRQEHERRQARLKERQEEQRLQKTALMQEWMEKDERRVLLAEKRRKQHERERQFKLAKMWEDRRHVQQLTLQHEQTVRAQAEEKRLRRLAERQKQVERRRKRQQAVLEAMTRKQREERERTEQEYEQRIAERTARRLSKRRRRKRKAKHKSHKVKGKHDIQQLRSNWDMMETLLLGLESEEGDPAAGQQDVLRRDAGDSQKAASSLDEDEDRLESSDLTEAERSPSLTETCLPTAARLTRNILEMIRQSGLPDESIGPEHIAKVLVEVNNYLASKVICPAAQRVKKAKPKRPLRFSMDVQCFDIDYSDDAYYDDDDRLDYIRTSSDDDDDDDDEDGEMENDDDHPSSRLVLAEDSLTKLRRLSLAAPGQRGGMLAGLAEVLTRILERLESGRLPLDQAVRLMAAAQDIVGDSPVALTPMSALSDLSLAPQSSSNTSLIAAEMVQTTMARLQQELLNSYTVEELDAYCQTQPLQATPSQLTGMAKFVAETALAMAVESLMSCSDEILSQQRLTVSTTATTSDSALLRSSTADGVSASDGCLPPRRTDSMESVSCTSRFIVELLAKVVEEVRQEYDASPAPLAGLRSSGPPRSAISLYVEELLQKAVVDVQAMMLARPAWALTGRAFSDTSLFVMDTLERVVKEIQRSREPSATSVFIDDLLARLAVEVNSGSRPRDADGGQQVNPLRHRSSASVTSVFIRDTLSRVLRQIDADFAAAAAGGAEERSPDARSATSLLAEQMVHVTLKKCTSALHQEMLPDAKLSELTAAILESQQRHEQQAGMMAASSDSSFRSFPDVVRHDSAATLSRPLPASASATMAENLIMVTLEKARDSLERGTMSAEQVVQVLHKVSASSGHQAAVVVDGQAVPAASCTPEQAHSYVTAAIEKAIGELSSGSEPTPGADAAAGTLKWDDNDSPPAVNAQEVHMLIQSILTKAIEELNQGLTNDYQGENEEDPDGACPPDSSQPAAVPEQPVIVDLSNLPDDLCDPNARAYYSDSDEEEEDAVNLSLIYKGQPLEVSQEVARKALGAISVKNLEEMEIPSQALPRQSFRSLICPDVTDISGLDTTSEESMKEQLVRASKGTLPSQTLLKLSAASRCSQTTNPRQLAVCAEDPAEKKPITRSLSLHDANPAEADAHTSPSSSPYGSPSSSPKASSIGFTRKALAGSSAPTLRTVHGPSSRLSPAGGGGGLEVIHSHTLTKKTSSASGSTTSQRPSPKTSGSQCDKASSSSKAALRKSPSTGAGTDVKQTASGSQRNLAKKKSSSKHSVEGKTLSGGQSPKTSSGTLPVRTASGQQSQPAVSPKASTTSKQSSSQQSTPVTTKKSSSRHSGGKSNTSVGEPRTKTFASEKSTKEHSPVAAAASSGKIHAKRKSSSPSKEALTGRTSSQPKAAAAAAATKSGSQRDRANGSPQNSRRSSLVSTSSEQTAARRRSSGSRLQASSGGLHPGKDKSEKEELAAASSTTTSAGVEPDGAEAVTTEQGSREPTTASQAESSAEGGETGIQDQGPTSEDKGEDDQLVARQTASGKVYPRESEVIEMKSSSSRPVITPSSSSKMAPTTTSSSTSSSSCSRSHRSVPLGPRPSSGFHRRISGHTGAELGGHLDGAGPREATGSSPAVAAEVERAAALDDPGHGHPASVPRLESFSLVEPPVPREDN